MPSELRRSVDRLARELDRSRSWVVAEAVRRLARQPAPEAAGAAAMPEPSRSPAGLEHAETELGRLRVDLSLSADERLRKADSLLRLHRILHPPARRQQIVAFDSHEDFHRWKRAHQVANAIPS